MLQLGMARFENSTMRLTGMIINILFVLYSLYVIIISDLIVVNEEQYQEIRYFRIIIFFHEVRCKELRRIKYEP
jgi:hypothetical protein